MTLPAQFLTEPPFLAYTTIFHESRQRQRESQPEIDLRETNVDYWIDVALPGVVNRKNAHIEWATNRELCIHGRIRRPPMNMDFLSPGSDFNELGRETSLSGPPLKEVGA